MGDITVRLRSVTPFKVNGLNKSGIGNLLQAAWVKAPGWQPG